MSFVGSKLSFIPCQLLGAQHGQSVSPTKSDAAWENIPEMTLAIDAPNENSSVPILPWCDCVLFLDPSLGSTLVTGEVRWAVDSVEVSGSVRAFGYRTPTIVGLTPGDMYPTIVLPQLRIDVPGGASTLSAQWRVTAGTATAYSTHRSIQAMSIPF